MQGAYTVGVRGGRYVLLQDGKPVPKKYTSDQAWACLDKLNAVHQPPKKSGPLVEVVKPC